MAPFAGLVFLLVGFYMITGRFKQPAEGLVSLEELPASRVSSCLKENLEANVSLSANNQISFAANAQEVRFESIRQVANNRCIRLSTSQLNELRNVAFLSTNVESLPLFLDTPASERNALLASHRVAPLDTTQLRECIAAAKSWSQLLFHKPLYITLSVAAETKAPHVESLLTALGAQGIHRFNLSTRYAEKAN